MGELVLIGGGGHAFVAYNIASLLGYSVVGYYAREVGSLPLPYLGDFINPDPNALYFCAIGDNKVRAHLTTRYPLRFATLIHPSSVVAQGVIIGEGSLVCAGTIIEPESKVGKHCIINTGSIINHHCTLSHYCHIAPSATLCGGVSVDAFSLIGAGAKVLPHLTITTNVIIGAGSIVLDDVLEQGVQKGLVKQEKVKWLAEKPINFNTVKELLAKSIASNHFTNGSPLTQRLEQYLFTLLQLKEDRAVVCVANGTVALHALVSTLNLAHGKKHRFATQAYTFPSSVQGPLQGSVIVDLDQDYSLDLEELSSREREEGKIDGLVLTNLFGHVVNLEKYLSYAREEGKFLILDNATAPLTLYQGSNINNYGVGTIISLHHTKPLGFGEGGAVVIEKRYEPFLRRIINFGYDLSKRDYAWEGEGSNYKLSDLSSAFILMHLTNFVAQGYPTYYQKLYQSFQEQVKGIGLSLLPHYDPSTPFASCLAVILPFPLSVKEVEDLSQKSKIELRKYYHPLVPLEKSVALWERILCFPLHKDVDDYTLRRYLTLLRQLIL